MKGEECLFRVLEGSGSQDKSLGGTKRLMRYFCWSVPIQGNAGMCSDTLARADEVDDGESFTRVFRLTVHKTASPKISSFKAFFIFSKSFTETAVSPSFRWMCTLRI